VINHCPPEINKKDFLKAKAIKTAREKGDRDLSRWF
jgi:hypothetical protein